MIKSVRYKRVLYSVPIYSFCEGTKYNLHDQEIRTLETNTAYQLGSTLQQAGVSRSLMQVATFLLVGARLVKSQCLWFQSSFP